MGWGRGGVLSSKRTLQGTRGYQLELESELDREKTFYVLSSSLKCVIEVIVRQIASHC